MSSKEVGIEQARKTLGDLVTAVQQGADIVLTRNGKPAARIVRYAEETATMDTTRDLPQDLIDALLAHDVDPTAVTLAPDGEMTIERDGGHIAIGSEPSEDDEDALWWTATAYVDDTEAMIYEGTDVNALAAALRR